MCFLPKIASKSMFISLFYLLCISITATGYASTLKNSSQQTKIFGQSQQIFLPLVTLNYDSTYVNPFGVVMYGVVDDTTGINQMKNAGAKRVTIVLDWGTVEPTEGVRDWSSIDAKVNNARMAGMDVDVLFTGDPSWAWLPDRSATIPEKRLNFVRAMVNRYNCDGVDDAGPQLCVHMWSFYAEPDYYKDHLQTTPGIKGYWGKRGKQYAQMLAGVANVIHERDSKARVLIGGLAYDWFEEQGGPFVRSFFPTVLGELNATYGGAGRYVDAVAVHYYPITNPSIRAKVNEIRGIMQSHGIGNLPIVIPETGYWSAAESGSSEQKQAQRLVQQFVEGLSVGVEYLSWFTVFDSGSGTESSGLFRGKNLASPKLAYFAYHTLTRELTGAKYLRALGRPGVEGHVFRATTGKEKTVVWTNSTVGYAAFNTSCLRIVSVIGTVYNPVVDGSPVWDQDRAVNGQILLGVVPDQPLYVEQCN